MKNTLQDSSMIVGLDKAQKGIKKAAAEFAKGEFEKELTLALDAEGGFPYAVLQQAGRLGFIGAVFDEAYGGAGMSAFENVLVAEEFCRRDVAMGAALMLSADAAHCLHDFGGDELKGRYLPDIIEGRVVSAGAFSESTHGHSSALSATTALEEPDGWRLDGVKTDVVNGPWAGIYLVSGRTDSDSDPARGLSLFLVESDREGVAPGPAEETLGLRMTGISSVTLSGVRIPSGHLIGRQGRAAAYLDAYAGNRQVLLAGLALGAAQGAFERARDYVKKRVQFGKKLAQFQVTRHKLAQMAMQIETARQLTYAAAGDQSARKPDPTLSAMAKMISTQTAVTVSNEAIQLLGGYGYMSEYEVERFYRDAKTLEVFGGSSYTLLDRIADSVIGRVR